MYRPTRNFWFENIFSTFTRQNSVVKNGSWPGDLVSGLLLMVQPEQWLIWHWVVLYRKSVTVLLLIHTRRVYRYITSCRWYSYYNSTIVNVPTTTLDFAWREISKTYGWMWQWMLKKSSCVRINTNKTVLLRSLQSDRWPITEVN